MSIVVAIDFDGTVVKHCYPEIGQEIPGAIDTMKWLMAKGAKIILYTMRSDKSLDEAVNFLNNKDIKLYGINRNPAQHWTNSPKVYANIYIDDAALGCPLICPKNERPYVDWVAVRAYLEKIL